MIILYKNTNNTVVVTLTEKTTLSPVYYLFEFINKESKKAFYIVPSDISTEKQRYNKFSIAETTSPPPFSLPEGEYRYNIYEQSNGFNLNPTGLNIVETGIAQAIDDTNNSNTIYTGAASNNVVYEG